MRVHRFMSAGEYEKLMRGEVLVNHTDHRSTKSGSIGFCFFTEPPKEAIHWLSGNVDCDYCVTMDIPEEMLTQSWGHYRDPKKHDLRTIYVSETMSMTKVEWCCQTYSKKQVKILNVSKEFAALSDMRRALRMIGLIP